MESKWLAVIVTVVFSCVGVLGDYFLKLASAQATPLRSQWFIIGFAVYASTAFGWIFVMQRLKLATIGVVYSVADSAADRRWGRLFQRDPQLLRNSGHYSGNRFACVVDAVWLIEAVRDPA